MKKILLIGKVDDTLKSLNEYLRRYFKVQVCTETTQNAGAIMKVMEPDLVLTLLAGVYDVDMSVFNIICRDYKNLPVVTIGTDGEFRNFQGYFQGNTFENLILPVDNEDVLYALCRRLDVTFDDIGKKATKDHEERHHILVVDDNAMTLRNIKSILDSKYRITLANSGMKAMAAIGRDRPDVILLDYEMPVCDGKQTLEMIRADDEMKSIPVIFLTGVSDRAHIEAVMQLRPSGYLLKPASQEKLIASIEAAL
ncbi:MAG: response regulator [Lachnospiraceae bacterium]|nr:response regulator [Lachnospiraceae bacterium]